MTLPPNRIGDKGQRYQVEAEGYPEDGWNVIGWSSDEQAAQGMADGISLAPTCTDARVIDRKKDVTHS